MAFWIYYHWARGKHGTNYHSLVHRGECGECHDGRGKRLDAVDGKRGKWVGSFETYEDARAKAGTYQGEAYQIMDCQHCNPSIPRS